jgi:vinculin
MSLARGIQQLMRELQDRCQKAVAATDRSDLRRPAHTIGGKLEQAQRWLANPAVDDKGLGQ